MITKHFYTKKLFKSNLGLSGMHDQYWTVPNDIDPNSFYTELSQGQNRITHVHKDKSTGRKYDFTTAKERNGEYRIYNASSFFSDKNAVVADEIYVEKIITDESVEYLIDIFKSGNVQEKTRKKAQIFQSKNLKSFNPRSRGYRSGQARKADDIIPQAEIYKVLFSIESNQYIYVGQDSFCSGVNSYFGSSLVMWHYENIFGKNIFKKEIIKTFKNIKQQDLNKHERNHINQAIQFASDNGCYCLNYTGQGKIFS